ESAVDRAKNTTKVMPGRWCVNTPPGGTCSEWSARACRWYSSDPEAAGDGRRSRRRVRPIEVMREITPAKATDESTDQHETHEPTEPSLDSGAYTGKDSVADYLQQWVIASSTASSLCCRPGRVG